MSGQYGNRLIYFAKIDYSLSGSGPTLAILRENVLLKYTLYVKDTYVFLFVCLFGGL